MALFSVPSLPSIASRWVNPIEAVDGHAFVILFQLARAFPGILPAVPVLETGDSVVVRIDDETYNGDYAGRSPLDRCKLDKHLGSIYANNPKVLIVDLDLSPAPAPNRRERGCQEQLDRLIRQHHAKTVLIPPFGSSDGAEWRKKMEADPKGVKFGKASVPVEFGLAVRGHVGQGSLVCVAANAARSTAPCTDKPVRIDPRLYLPGGLDLLDLGSIKDLPKDGLRERVEERVVFFGATYGSEEDLFLTPIGEVYGVELHAATYESRGDPTRIRWKKLVEIVLDIIMASIFGFVSLWCWTQYFVRVAGGGRARQTASVFVLLLLVAYSVLLFVTMWGSAALMIRFGFWLSPIPLAIGMFIDGFISGAPAAGAYLFGRKEEETRAGGSGGQAPSVVGAIPGGAFWFLWGESQRLCMEVRQAGQEWTWRSLECWAPVVMVVRRWVWMSVVIVGIWAMQFD